MTKIVVTREPMLETKLNPNTENLTSYFFTLESVLVPSVGPP